MSFIFLLTVSMVFSLVDTFYQDFDFCNENGQELLIADFNGDKKADLFCIKRTDGTGPSQMWFLYSKDSLGYDSTAISELSWCAYESKLGPFNGTFEIYLGDFNGDGRMDLLCHENKWGYKKIALADASGRFTGTSWEKQTYFCWSKSFLFYTADFNGDGRTDLLCRSIPRWGTSGTGVTTISHALQNETYFHTFSGYWFPEIINITWCNTETGQLFLGDFNGDGRDDILCHERTSGYKALALATNSGTFAEASWESDMQFCFGPGEKLFIGNFNRDGRTDMLCKYPDEFGIYIVHAAEDGSFGYESTYNIAMNWCSRDGDVFDVGDFDGDGLDDLMCKDESGLILWLNDFNWV